MLKYISYPIPRHLLYFTFPHHFFFPHSLVVHFRRRGVRRLGDGEVVDTSHTYYVCLCPSLDAFIEAVIHVTYQEKREYNEQQDDKYEQIPIYLLCMDDESRSLLLFIGVAITHLG